MAENKPYFQTDFARAEFSQRRARVAEAIGPGSVALLQGAPESGAFETLRQSNEYYYLCGVETPHAYLLIDGGSPRSTLFLPPHDSKHERSEGRTLHADAPDEVRQLTGVVEVKSLAALLPALQVARIVYIPHSPAEGRQVCRDTALHAQKNAKADPWCVNWPPKEQRFIEKVNQAAPLAEIRDLTPHLDQMRVLKSPGEVNLMRVAGRLSALAVAEAMRCTRPGLMEFHLGAAAEYIYSVNGAMGGAYRPIIASGENIWNAHYYRNNCVLRDGDLVLLDYAPDYRYYTSDIGRMWPINGTYNRWQRELYGFVVEYHTTLLELIRPGVSAGQITEEAALKMARVVDARRWSSPAFERAAREMLKFQGHLSHGVGMAVHDAGDYKRNGLAPGVVFALDPQLWVPDEKLYIRVEDTVVVTENGNENLTELAPLHLDDVEKLMREDGLLERNPPLSMKAAHE